MAYLPVVTRYLSRPRGDSHLSPSPYVCLLPLQPLSSHQTSHDLFVSHDQDHVTDVISADLIGSPVARVNDLTLASLVWYIKQVCAFADVTSLHT